MVGVGIMGSRMCANLVAKGFDVRAFDLDAGALERARQGAPFPVRICAPLRPTRIRS
ncbi:MAG: hypothetical protein HC807_08290, partial [Gammaproteobacteria bacterium]|nr:hypothetical protein [Gammaproteobacteria bacterium]